MLHDLLLPEDILQLDKLSGAIELTDDTSFLAIIGIDTLDLNKEFKTYINTHIQNHIYYEAKSNKILNELVSLNDQNNFIVVDMFDKTDNEFIKDLLFYRDLISDHSLKIILIVNQNGYKYILKNAIDFYNINTFAYIFNTYKVDIVKSVNRDDLDKLLEEYKTKKSTLSKVQKANYLYNIGIKYNYYGEIQLALKNLNEALAISNKLKNNELIIYSKFQLSILYQKLTNYKLAEKYLIEVKQFYKINKNNLQYKDAIHTLVILYYEINKLDIALKYNNELYQLSLNTYDKQNELEALKMFLLIYNKKKDDLNTNLYMEKVINLASQLNNKEILNTINQMKAVNNLNNKDYKNALIYANHCIQFYKKNKHILMLNDMYSITAQIYTGLNDYNKSMVYCNWCYNYFKKHNLLDNVLRILQILSLNYQSLNQYNKSLDKLNEALKVSKQLKLHEEELNIYLLLSSIADLQKDYKKSLEYLDKACNLANHISNYDYHNIYAQYANTYNNLNDLDNAYMYYNKALKLKENLNDISYNTYLAELYGEILVNDNKYEEALNSFQDALNLAIKINQLSRVISVEENLAYLYKKLNNPSLAKRFFNEVINKLEIIDKKNPKIKILRQEITEF